MRNIVLLIFTLLFCTSVSAEVNIYSARKEALIKPLLKEFSKTTGIRVNLITGDADALIKRLEIEGENSPADVLLTVDAARLYRALQKGLFQKLPDGISLARVPELYRDPENYWVGLSLRARVIIYAEDKVNPDELSTYEDLANPEWHGKICVRSSSNIYNQSLLASLVARLGVEQAESWARGLVKNLARAPKGGDRDQVKAVAAGQCQLALVNTYYIGGMQNSSIKAEQEAVARVGVYWPNQNGSGVHINVSGIGITRSSVNADEARQLIEFLLSDAAQHWYAESNFEYPVVEGIPVSETLRRWGEFQADKLPLNLLGKYNSEAVRIMDRAGWK